MSITESTLQPGIETFTPPEVETYDNHSLSYFQTCPAKYYYRMILQITPAKRAPALGFGISMHSGREAYKVAIKRGMDHMSAIMTSLAKYQASWMKEMPDEMKADNMKEDLRGLENGLKLLEGYLQKFRSPNYEPIHVEVPFAMSLGKTFDGTEVIYSGIVDDVSKWQGYNLVGEFKTTSWFPDANFFERFRVSQAIFGYIKAAQEILNEPIHGAYAHGMWVHKEPKQRTSRSKDFGDFFQSSMIAPAQTQIDEAMENVVHTVEDVHVCKSRKFFPYNFGDACNMYRGCAYRDICRVPKVSRQAVIDQQYVKEYWNPLAAERAKRDEDG